MGHINHTPLPKSHTSLAHTSPITLIPNVNPIRRRSYHQHSNNISQQASSANNKKPSISLNLSRLNTLFTMSLLNNAIRSSSTRLLRNLNLNPNQGLRSLPPGSLSHRLFSTESESSTNQSSTKPMFETPSSGLVYGKLSGITKHTLKSDVLSLLEECNLSVDDLKVDYNPLYMPMGMMVQFPSRSAYDAAFKAVGRKGRLYKLERADRSIWDSLKPYGGKHVVLQGIPPNAILEDIERFLAGCEFDPSDIRLFTRQGASGSTRMALVRFASPTAAMTAMITKNRGFCFNNQISMHVLQ